MAVLISIRPKWCERIAAGRKTLELRKSKPALSTPFKCYIYQTKHREHNGPTYSDGKVIGEFVCDHILGHCEMANADIAEQRSCVRREDIFLYSGGKEVFGWHISDLVIYAKPKELRWFQKPSTPAELWYKDISIKRPPQSWCYVEEATPCP